MLTRVAGGDCKLRPAEADRAAARALCLSTALARTGPLGRQRVMALRPPPSDVPEDELVRVQREMENRDQSDWGEPPPDIPDSVLRELQQDSLHGNWLWDEFVRMVGRDVPVRHQAEFLTYAVQLHEFIGILCDTLAEAQDDIEWLAEQLDARDKQPTAPIQVSVERRAVTCGDESFDIPSEQAVRWLKVLADRPGVWVSGADLQKYDPELVNVRTDQLKRQIPIQVRRFIDSKQGTGSRLRAE